MTGSNNHSISRRSTNSVPGHRNRSYTGLANTSVNTSSTSITSSVHKSHVVTGSTNSKILRKPTTPVPTSPSDVIEALEAERSDMRAAINDMHAQISELTYLLKEQDMRQYEQRGGTGGDGVSGGGGIHSTTTRHNRRQNARNQRSHPGSTRTGSKGDHPDHTFHSEDDIETGIESDREESEGHTQRSETAQEMLHKLTIQTRRISQLEHRCESYKRAEESNEDLVRQMRSRTTEMRDEIENLRLELNNRPTMRQWNLKITELQDLEDKLHDLVMMRGEAAEIAAWRQHLSTKDRIQVDKRNYELGLWLLDSLPKAVAKEILQGVCRELDVSDVSEIINSIVKLKTVVKTVPRMDRFISQVCAFLFQRDKTILASLPPPGSSAAAITAAQPTMEDVVPVLKRLALS